MRKILLDNNYKPKGETDVHYELKQIAKYILRINGYTIIGDEITTGYDTYLYNYDQFNEHKKSKSIIDIIGISHGGDLGEMSLEYTYKKKDKRPNIKSWGIEAKATLSDFKNGFNTACEKVSIITPKGIIPIELVPPKIGLIEVDLETYKICDKHGFYIKQGVEEIIKPKVKYDRYLGNNKQETKENHQVWCNDMIKEIALRHSNVMMWKRQEIDIEIQKVRGRKKGRR